MLQMPHGGTSNLCGLSNCCFSASGGFFLTATPNGLRAVSLIGSSTDSEGPANPSVLKPNVRMAYPVEFPSAPIHPLTSTRRPTNERLDSLPIGTELYPVGRPFTVRHFSTLLAASTFLWSSPVRVVAAAGDSPIVAVLFEHPEPAEYEGDLRPQHSSPHPTETSIPHPRSSSAFLPFKGCPHVHLFDASTGVCLVELYFCGALAYSLRANAHFLLVGMRDCFHVINIRTLAHVRKESAPNLIDGKLLTLSQFSSMKVYAHPSRDEELKCKKDVSGNQKQQTLHEAWRIAYPSQPQSDSTRGMEGTVRVLTICLPSSYGLPQSVLSPAAPMSNPTALMSPTQENRKQLPKQEPSPSFATPCARVDTIYQSQIAISPHRHALAALQLSMDGTLLASASIFGSTVKLMDAVHGVILRVFQRGHLRATVHALAFSPNASSLAALSSSGTLHIFHCCTSGIFDNRGKLGGTEAENSTAMNNATMSTLGNILNKKRQRAFIKKVVRPLSNTLTAIPRLNFSGSHSPSSAAHAFSVRGRMNAADTLCFGRSHENSLIGSSSAACRTPKFSLPVENCTYSMCFSSDEKHVWVAQQRGTPATTSAAGAGLPQKASTRIDSMMKRGDTPASWTSVNIDTLVNSDDASTAISNALGWKDSNVVYASLQRFTIDEADLFANEIYNVKL